ncbi:glycosyltransferase [Sphingomonas baiyangensis]|uniref:Glycosyltransferase n=1 Tax=Sphingomonas baiyangensis TaxID=2572576 RepID=A0A4U1L1J6_9SPHN|nr:glycosyltransferase [Sphingomonas baiyangensis]TKD50689.1 glycosyltransferase [Sphingomonas baiyangensis]
MRYERPMLWLALFSLGFPLIVFAGYPAAMLFAAKFVGRRPTATGAMPCSLSVLICAHNEAAHIGAKIASVQAALAGWPGRHEIIVGDDGSTDDTATIAEAMGVRVVRCARGGKAAALQRIARMASGEVLVMTDADPLFEADTVRALLAPLDDPQVGAVAGRVDTLAAKGRVAGFAAADRLFRRYEAALRDAEDRLFGCISADGGLYAIRAALMPPVPADVTDDFWVSTAAVAAGRRIAYADDARVWEHSIAGNRRQFRRRVRITVRGLTGLWRRRALMNPARTGWYAVGLVLHKLGRRVAPVALVPLPIASTMLAAGGSLFWTLVALASAGVAVATLAAQAGIALPRPLRLLANAGLHLAGLATGAVLFASGRRYAQWTPQKIAPA